MHSIDPYIQFIQETPNVESSIPFLDTLDSQGPDNTSLTRIYRKPTHIDQSPHWDIHHNLFAIYGVFNTLTHRARTVCYNTQLLHEGDDHAWVLYLGANMPYGPSIDLRPKITTSTAIHRIKAVPETMTPSPITATTKKK